MNDSKQIAKDFKDLMDEVKITGLAYLIAIVIVMVFVSIKGCPLDTAPIPAPSAVAKDIDIAGR